jgi:hypothetical protein
MKKIIVNLLCGGFFILAAAGFAGCTSTAQSRVDELFPRQEQARILGPRGVVELIALDGEDVSSLADLMSGTPPGLPPGQHSLEFYFGTWGTVSVPGKTTTSTVYSSGNVSVTSSRTQTDTAISYKRVSDLMTAEYEFKPGRAYGFVNGDDGKPIIYEAGYSDWYWQWRVETKKPEETLVTIEDEHGFVWREGSWPFILVIDGEPYLHFVNGQEYEIVLLPGPHTFAIIDKKDPLNEAISASFEMVVAAGEAEFEIQGEGPLFTVVELSEEARAAAKQAEAGAEVKKAEDADAAMRRDFPLANAARKPGPGESVLEIKVDLMFGLGISIPFFLDGKPVANLQNDESIRVIIPNGRHTISVRDDGYAVEEFTAKSNLVTAAWEQNLWVSLNVEVKPLD